MDNYLKNNKFVYCRPEASLMCIEVFDVILESSFVTTSENFTVDESLIEF